MTAFDRFDPFEQRIVEAIDEIAAARRPDYLDDVFRRTERSSQRPRWSFPGRWLPIMDTTLPGAPARAPLRPLLLVAIAALLALAAITIFMVGSRPKVPSPVGPAQNGSLIYTVDGDLWSRPSIADGEGHPVVTGQVKQSSPYISPDGRTIAYAETRADGDHLMAVDIDGANPRDLLPEPIQEGWSMWSWSPDSQHLLASGVFPGGTKRLYVASADGSPARELVFDGLIPWEAFWNPVDPDRFVMRAQKTIGVRSQGLYVSNAAGTTLRPLALTGQSAFGDQFTLAGATWSPDGRTIAYNAVVTEDKSFLTSMRVHLIDADGSNDRLLSDPGDPHIQEAWPVYSPDGSQILVQRFIFASGADAKDASGWIAVAPSDGSAPARDIGARITNTSNPDTIKVWSPDGKTVVQLIDETHTTYLVDPVTGVATVLPWTTELPEWQRTTR